MKPDQRDYLTTIKRRLIGIGCGNTCSEVEVTKVSASVMEYKTFVLCFEVTQTFRVQ